MDIAGGKRLGTHILVHRSDLNQMLKAFPQHGDAGWAITFPVQGTAQLCDPAHRHSSVTVLARI